MATTALAAIVLAAGKGTRMKSNRSKVLHELRGQPLVAYPVALARRLKASPCVIVVGHQAEAVQARLGSARDLRYAVQSEQRGTGHAVMEGMKALKRFSGAVLVLSGDVPLLSAATARKAARLLTRSGSSVVALTMRLDDPTGYGRIVREGGRFSRIVEHKDCTDAQREITEVNAGIYCFDARFLRKNLGKLATNNAQGEYYLTDLIEIAAQGAGAAALVVDDADEVCGVNDRNQLATLDAKLRARINTAHMSAGVTMIDPSTVYIDADVKIGRDTIIYPNVHLRGDTRIGPGCTIDTGSVLVDAKLGRDVTVRAHTMIEQAEVRARAILGPFARLRPGAQIMEQAHVGNFVELKKTRLGKGAKANHLSYLGDSDIGARTNVGAGTITCNYDGFGKYLTRVGTGVFIGSNATLVAPLDLDNGAYVAAGSTVTDPVGRDGLALGRARQVNKPGRAARVRAEASERAAKNKAKNKRKAKTSKAGAKKTPKKRGGK